MLVDPPLRTRLAAEFLGTFWLVFAGCGSAVIASAVLTPDGQQIGIGLLGVSLAFGLSVVTMAYAVGHISGGHFNPAVTLGLAVAGRVRWADAGPYALTQVVAAIVAAAALLAIATGAPGFDLAVDGLATNGYGGASPGGYTLIAALVTELVMTFVFVLIILGATDTRAPRGMAPLAIGLSLTLIHLVSIPVTNTSVNPARSIGPALLAGGPALGQLWLFVLAPLAAAVAAATVYGLVFARHTKPASLQDSAGA